MSVAIPATAKWTKEECKVAKKWGADLRRVRKTAGLSALELANQIEVHRNTIMRWELGLWVPNIIEAAKIKRVLDAAIEAKQAAQKARSNGLATPPSRQ
jgi:DNA-binding XRE family transcriptional regulator